MYIALVVLLFATLATALFALGAAVFAPSSALGIRLQTLIKLNTAPTNRSYISFARVEQALDSMSKLIPRSTEEESQTRQLMIQAGYREPRHVMIYYGIRTLLAGLAIAFVALSFWGRSHPVMFIALPLLAFITPGFVLKRMIKARQNTLRLSLPDALDLIVICVESGLGLDQAIQRVSKELRVTHKQLSDELEVVHLEVRAGKQRAEALRNLATRTGVDDIRTFVAVLIQTERFGTGIAQGLRVHSDALRTERRQRAEESANKVSVKMVPVLVFFIFPSMFFVSLGPAAISIIRTLFPIMEH